MTKEKALQLLGSDDAEKVVGLLKDLRNRADVAENEFLTAVLAFEVSGLWRNLAAGTFDQALTKTHVCAPERYSRWKRANEELGEVVVEQIGVCGATQVMRIENQRVRKLAVAELEASRKREGTIPSDRNVRTIVRRYIVDRKPSKPEPNKVEALERENSQLKRRVKELEKENAMLRERLAPARSRSKKSHGRERAEARS